MENIKTSIFKALKYDLTENFEIFFITIIKV